MSEVNCFSALAEVQSLPRRPLCTGNRLSPSDGSPQEGDLELGRAAPGHQHPARGLLVQGRTQSYSRACTPGSEEPDRWAPSYVANVLFPTTRHAPAGAQGASPGDCRIVAAWRLFVPSGPQYGAGVGGTFRGGASREVIRPLPSVLLGSHKSELLQRAAGVGSAVQWVKLMLGMPTGHI